MKHQATIQQHEAELRAKDEECDKYKTVAREMETKMFGEHASFETEIAGLRKMIEDLNQLSRLNILHSDTNNFHSNTQNQHNTNINTTTSETNNFQNIHPIHQQDNEVRPNTGFSNSSFLGFNLKPDFYDGSTPLREYLNQFEIVSRANNCDDSVKTTALASYLRGKARVVWNNFSSVSLNFSKLKEKLEMRFGDTHLSAMNYTLFQNRRQKPGEDLQSLASDLEQMASSIYAECPFEIQDKIVCSQFIIALNDFSVRKTLQLEGVTSLKQALARAMEVTTINDLFRNFRNVRNQQWQNFNAQPNIQTLNNTNQQDNTNTQTFNYTNQQQKLYTTK